MIPIPLVRHLSKTWTLHPIMTVISPLLNPRTHNTTTLRTPSLSYLQVV